MIDSSSNISANNLGSSTIPSIKKSLRELSKASSTLGLSADNSSSSNSSYHPLLTQRGIDTAKLQRHVHELEFHHTTPPYIGNAVKKQRRIARTIPHTTSLTQYLNYTRDAQLEGILDREMEKAKGMTDERVRSRLVDDWDQMKKKIMGSVIGGRQLGGLQSKKSGMGSDVLMEPGICKTYVDEQGNLPSFAQTHLDFLLSSTDGRDDGIKPKKIAELLEGQRKKNSATLGYYNANRLLDSMLFSSTKSTVETRTMGALKFLANDFKSFLISSVQNAGGRREGIGASLVEYIKVFVEMEVGREKVRWGGMDIFWRCLYYSLRCGDVKAALEIVESWKEIPSVILDILKLMTQNQQNDTNIFESTSGTVSIKPSLRQQVIDLHHRATSTNGNSVVDGYELACLGMLSLSSPSFENSSQQVAKTMEDYMYVRLWNAFQSDDKDEVSLSSCSGQIATLGEDVKHWGPAHFDDETGMNPWAYAHPLLLCQQFRSALIHLANVSGGEGLCMAVHLGLGMRSIGSVIHDCGSEHGSEYNDQSKEQDLLVRLLTMYSSSLQGVSPESALVYLINIPDVSVGVWKTGIWMKNGQQLSNTALEHISGLLLASKKFQALVGSLSLDGSRNSTGAAMDHHLTSDGVAKVLAYTADRAIRQENVADAAELLFLGGQYCSLLALLNQQLASNLLIGGEGDEQKASRKFWRDAALGFHEAYLANGQTHVIQVLERENKLSLGNTFQLLLNLMSFFDQCNENKWESAWSLIDGLDLFPRTESEIPYKAESFNSLDSEIQQQYHHIITNTMECLYQQYEALKMNFSGEVGSPSVTAIQQRLNEIRTRGGLLVTFVAYIPFMNFSDEAKARIARVEAFMI